MKMPGKAFAAIAEGLEDAIAYAKGDSTKGRARTPKIPDVDVAELRGRLGLSQSEFARGFGVSVGTLRNWEQHRRQPEGPARVLLTVIHQNPQPVIDAIWPSKKRAIRKSRPRKRAA
jgi:putative transcriptional regulator